ncbi:MAG: hypothetical protein V4472_22945 [Pseudomonadota bacterium]
MNDAPKADTGENPAGVAYRPEWKTPMLSEDSIVESTQNYFLSGIDNYEATNATYGS